MKQILTLFLIGFLLSLTAPSYGQETKRWYDPTTDTDLKATPVDDDVILIWDSEANAGSGGTEHTTVGAIKSLIDKAHVGLANVENVKHAYNLPFDPTNTMDSSINYVAGKSIAIRDIGTLFICIDDTVNAAVWVRPKLEISDVNGLAALISTANQKAALDAANNPSGTNAIATLADIAASGGGDMLGANNLSELTNLTLARSNLDVDQAGTVNYVHPATHPASIITESSTKRFITDTERLNWNGSYTHSQTAHAPSTAEQNVQSDWNEANPALDAYIANKPTIPSTPGEVGAEPALGSPLSDGQVLASTATGVRSWATVGAGDMLAANNLNDLVDKPTALTNLGAAPAAKGVTGGDTHDHAGGDGGQIAYGSLSGRPPLGTASPLNVAAVGNAAAGEVVMGNDTRLADARTPVTHSHPATEISDSTIAGRSMVTAVDVAAQRTLLNVEDGANNYVHPANHLPSVITQDASNRFVSDAEKATWSAKQDALVAGTDYLSPTGDGSGLTGLTSGQVGLASVNNCKQNVGAVVPPSVTADSSIDYCAYESYWFLTDNTFYQARDVTVGAAVWAGPFDFADIHVHANAATLAGIEEAYTTAEKTKLASIATGAEVNVNADWTASGTDAEILNKPIIPDLLAPGPIGSTTPDTGAFTVLTADSLTTSAADGAHYADFSNSGDVNTTGWGAGEEGRVWVNRATDVLRWWDGSAAANLATGSYSGQDASSNTTMVPGKTYNNTGANTYTLWTPSLTTHGGVYGKDASVISVKPASVSHVIYRNGVSLGAGYGLQSNAAAGVELQLVGLSSTEARVTKEEIGTWTPYDAFPYAASANTPTYPNTTTGSFSDQTVTLTNDGQRSITLDAVTPYALTTGTIFTVTGTPTCTAGLALAAAQTCSVDVRFSPALVQAYSDTLTFNVDELVTDPTSILSGTGVSPTAYLIDEDFEGVGVPSGWQSGVASTDYDYTPAIEGSESFSAYASDGTTVGVNSPSIGVSGARVVYGHFIFSTTADQTSVNPVMRIYGELEQIANISIDVNNNLYAGQTNGGGPTLITVTPATVYSVWFKAEEDIGAGRNQITAWVAEGVGAVFPGGAGAVSTGTTGIDSGAVNTLLISARYGARNIIDRVKISSTDFFGAGI